MGDIKQLGSYKTKFAKPLYASDKIKTLLLGKNYSEIDDCEGALDKHISDACFIDGVIEEVGTYIFFDVVMPKLGSSTKTVKILVNCLSHRSILNDFRDLTSEIKKDYPGNRTDKLAEIIEEIISSELVKNEFGIGNIVVDDIGFCNTSKFYGRTFALSCPDFR